MQKNAESLNSTGNPSIDLPRDTGDGPFLSAPSAGPNAQQAETKEVFRRTDPFEDNILTNNRLMGPSSHISLGRFHVSDTLKPNTFRRVHQTFTHRPSPDLQGTFEIRFTGAGMAITREAFGALEGRAGPQPPGAFADAMSALEMGKMLAQPTLPAQSTTYEVQLRMPGYEPGGGRTQSVDPRCILAASEQGKRFLAQNTIKTFHFGNSARERKVFPITYPVGRSIPVIFDVINRTPLFAITVDLIVDVMIDRTKFNERRERNRE